MFFLIWSNPLPKFLPEIELKWLWPLFEIKLKPSSAMDEIHSFIVIKVLKHLLCCAAGMSHQNQKSLKNLLR